MVGTSIYQWKGVLQGYSKLCSLCKCSSDWLGYHSFADCADTCSRQGFTRFQHAKRSEAKRRKEDFNCACCRTGTSGDPEWGVNVYDFGAADLEERFSSASIPVICSDCGCPVSETSWSPYGEEVEACAERCELKTSFFQRRDDFSGPCSCCASPTLNTGQGHLLGQNVYQWKGVLQGYSSVCELYWCNEGGWLGYHSFADCTDTCYRQGFSHFQHANGQTPGGGTGDYNCACCNTDLYTSDPTWGVNVYAFQSTVPAVSASSRARLVPSAALALCLSRLQDRITLVCLWRDNHDSQLSQATCASGDTDTA